MSQKTDSAAADNSRRVVVTAMGAISPLGSGVSATLDSIKVGKDCVSKVERFDVSETRSSTAGQISDEWLASIANRSRQHKRLHRASHMMISAMEEAFSQDPDFGPTDCAVFGTTSGGMSNGEEFLREAGSGSRPRNAATLVANYTAQKPIIDALTEVGINAPLYTIANACASGTNAIGHAFQLIRAGLRDRIVTGGYDAISQMVFCGFDCLQASTGEKIRPFDAERSGLVLGEAAAVLLLEDYESAKARGANILAEVIGYGVSTDNHHLTQPHPSGIGPRQAMERCLTDAGIAASEVSYINAHGTATPFNDATEGKAISEVFGSDVPVSSSKSMMGHSLGAAGAIEAVISILAIRNGILPPNINFRSGEEDHSVNLVDDCKTDALVGVVLSNSFGFGGTNASILLANPERKDRPENTYHKPLGSSYYISGTGVTTPLGGDMASVWQAVNSAQKAELGTLSNPNVDRSYPYYPVPKSAYASLGRIPRLRRSSPISYFGVHAGLAALRDSGIDLDPDSQPKIAVVFAVSTGDVQYTRRFFQMIIDDGAGAASPLLFPETVYNAPASHMAAVMGIDGESYTLVGDAASGISALRFATELLSLHDLDHVLVVGAEEADWSMADAHDAWRITADLDNPDSGVVFSEGAAALVVSRKGGVKIDEFSKGSIYDTRRIAKEESQDSCKELFTKFSDMYIDGSNGSWIDACQPSVEGKSITPKAFLGDAVGASGLLQVALAAYAMREDDSIQSAATVVTGMLGHIEGVRLTSDFKG